jgi:hypothetical protein
MQYSVLGPTGVKVSRICLGTATVGVAPSVENADRIVGTALHLGINFENGPPTRPDPTFGSGSTRRAPTGVTPRRAATSTTGAPASTANTARYCWSTTDNSTRANSASHTPDARNDECTAKRSRPRSSIRWDRSVKHVPGLDTGVRSRGVQILPTCSRPRGPVPDAAASARAGHAACRPVPAQRAAALPRQVGSEGQPVGQASGESGRRRVRPGVATGPLLV